MFNAIIISYCDTMIQIHQYIKSIVTEKKLNIKDMILNMERNQAIEHALKQNKKYINIICTRRERYLFYKKFKGKDSPFMIFSCGYEDENTNKKLIIKRK